LKTCKKKWEEQESLKPVKLRRPVPESPKNYQLLKTSPNISQAQLLAYNEEAFNDFNEKALVQCPNCPRTFLPDRLEVHLRSCKGSASKSSKLQSPEDSKIKTGLSKTMSPPSSYKIGSSPKIPMKPKAYICYLC